MRTVKQYCDYLEWSIAELSRRSGIAWDTANKAYKRADEQGKAYVIARKSKRDIAEAFSSALGRIVHPGDIEW